jgi:hypothetical protein
MTSWGRAEQQWCARSLVALVTCYRMWRHAPAERQKQQAQPPAVDSG